MPKIKPTSIKPPKKIRAKFSYPKNPGIKDFKPHKILRSSPLLEIRSGVWRKVSKGREKIKREDREREIEGGFLCSLSPPPPHCCFSCSLLFAPCPLSERLEQAICYGTLFSLLQNVTINSKWTRNVGLGFFIALFLHWFAFTTNVGNLLHVNTGMIDPAWSENPLTHILRTLKKISSLCLYCYVLVIFNIKTVHTALNFNRKSETTPGSFITTLLRYFTCSSLSTAILFRRQLLL